MAVLVVFIPGDRVGGNVRGEYEEEVEEYEEIHAEI